MFLDDAKIKKFTYYIENVDFLHIASSMNKIIQLAENFNVKNFQIQMRIPVYQGGSKFFEKFA